MPEALVDLQPLGGMGLDLVGVATPPATHAEVIRNLPDVPIVCEKPAVGMGRPAAVDRGRRAPVWVNYAFSYLDVAQRAAAALDRIGSVRWARTASEYDGDRPISAAEWFFEVSVHPWSWLIEVLGTPSALPDGSAAVAPLLPDSVDRRTIDVRCGAVTASVCAAPKPGLSGVRHTVEIGGEHGRLRLAGAYRAAQPWRFEAPQVDDGTGWREFGGPEEGLPDPWYLANARSIATMVAAVHDPAVRVPFDWGRAVAMDRLAQDSLAAQPR